MISRPQREQIDSSFQKKCVKSTRSKLEYNILSYLKDNIPEKDFPVVGIKELKELKPKNQKDVKYHIELEPFHESVSYSFLRENATKPKVIFKMISDIIRGIEFLHEHGITHNDLFIGNIMYNKLDEHDGYQFAITDFDYATQFLDQNKQSICILSRDMCEKDKSKCKEEISSTCEAVIRRQFFNSLYSDCVQFLNSLRACFHTLHKEGTGIHKTIFNFFFTNKSFFINFLFLPYKSVRGQKYNGNGIVPMPRLEQLGRELPFDYETNQVNDEYKVMEKLNEITKKALGIIKDTYLTSG